MNRYGNSGTISYFEEWDKLYYTDGIKKLLQLKKFSISLN